MQKQIWFIFLGFTEGRLSKISFYKRSFSEVMGFDVINFPAQLSSSLKGVFEHLNIQWLHKLANNPELQYLVNFYDPIKMYDNPLQAWTTKWTRFSSKMCQRLNVCGWPKLSFIAHTMQMRSNGHFSIFTNIYKNFCTQLCFNALWNVLDFISISLGFWFVIIKSSLE